MYYIPVLSKLHFLQSFLQTNDPSKKHSKMLNILLNIFVKIEQHMFLNRFFCNNVEFFTVTFKDLQASLLNISIQRYCI